MISNEFQSSTDPRILIYPRNLYYSPMEKAYSPGGFGLGDISKGLVSYPWQARWDPEDQFFKISKISEGSEIQVFQESNKPKWFDFCFDQNLRPFFVFVTSEGNFYYGFDTITGENKRLPLPEDIREPSVFLDRIFIEDIPESDIVMVHRTGTKVYYRLQRDRFTVSYEIKNIPEVHMLWRAGISQDHRPMIQIR